MDRLRIYRFLMGSLGIGCVLFGAGLVFAFFSYQRPYSDPAIPTGPIGHYFVAMAGCGFMGWGGGMLGAARDPYSSRTLGTMTVFVLIVMAIIRMGAWVIGDYSAWLGEIPRQEAAVMLLLALALIWLRPTVAESVNRCAGTDTPSEPRAGGTPVAAAPVASGEAS